MTKIRIAAYSAILALFPAGLSVAQDNQTMTPPAANMQANDKTKTLSAEQTISDWKPEPKKAAKAMMDKYGQPRGVTPHRLIWTDKAPFTEIILINEEIQHDFPMPHKDCLEHVVNFKVPTDKVGDLAEFDGSIIVDRTRGTLSARCDSEAHNLLALNLAWDIINNKKSVEEARKAYGQMAMKAMKGEKGEYLTKLMFQPMPRAGDAGTTTVEGQPNEAQPAVARSDASQEQSTDKTRQDAKNQRKLVGVIAVIPLAASDAALPRGAKFDTDVSAADDIRETLAEATEAAFTKGGLNDIVERFVDRDRNRLEKAGQMKDETLDGRIAQLQKAWKDKYGQEFDIKEARVYTNLGFAQGEITDAATFANQWPVDPTPMKEGEGAQPAGGKVLTDQIQDQGNIENGREIAVVRMPAEFGLPELRASFIDEAFGWKINVPNNLSAEQLHANVLKHLTYMGENMDKWPADVNDAYRAATHHVLMAVYGVDVPRANGGEKN